MNTQRQYVIVLIVSVKYIKFRLCLCSVLLYINFQITQEQNKEQQIQQEQTVTADHDIPQNNKKLSYDEEVALGKKLRLEYTKQFARVKKYKPIKLILILLCATIMAPLDQTITNICLPSIQTDPNWVEQGESIPQSTLQYVNDLYSIGFSAMAIPAGVIFGDRFGQTRTNLVGILAFGIFSALCACSHYITKDMCPWPYGGFWVLVVMRLFQGIAGAFNMSNTLSITAQYCEQDKIPLAISLNSMVFSVASGLGPVLGGVLVEYCGWEYCFWINLVFGTIGFITCIYSFREKPPTLKLPRADWLGTILLLVGLIVLIVGITFIPPNRDNQLMGGIMTGVGLVILIVFIFNELKHPFAILPREVLTSKPMVCSVIAAAFNFALITCMTFSMPFVYQTMKCISADTVGLIMLAIPVAQIIGSLMSTPLAKHVCSFWVKMATSLLSSAFLLTLGDIVPGSVGGIITVQFFFVMFQGMYFISNNQYLMQSCTPGQRGTAGSVVQFGREFGYCFGIAMVNVFQDIYMGKHWTDDVPVDKTCSTEPFLTYRDTYYDSVFFTDCCMISFVVITLIFAYLAGFGKFERSLLGYPKRLLEKTEYTKIDNNDKPEDVEELTKVEDTKEKQEDIERKE